MSCPTNIDKYEKIFESLMKFDPIKYRNFDNAVEFIYKQPLKLEQKKLTIHALAYIYKTLGYSDKKGFYNSGKSDTVLKLANLLDNTESYINSLAKIYSFQNIAITKLKDIEKEIENLDDDTNINLDETVIKNLANTIKNFFNVSTFETPKERDTVFDDLKNKVFELIDSKVDNEFTQIKQRLKQVFDSVIKETQKTSPYIPLESISELADLDTYLLIVRANINGIEEMQMIEAYKDEIENRYYVLDENLERDYITKPSTVSSKYSRRRDQNITFNGQAIFNDNHFFSNFSVVALNKGDQEELTNILNNSDKEIEFSSTDSEGNETGGIKIYAMKLNSIGDDRIKKMHDLAVNEETKSKYALLLNRNHETFETDNQTAYLQSKENATVVTVSRPKLSEQKYGMIGSVLNSKGEEILFHLYPLNNYVFVNSDNSTRKVDFTNPEDQKLLQSIALVEYHSGFRNFNEDDIKRLANQQRFFNEFQSKIENLIEETYGNDENFDKAYFSFDITEQFKNNYKINYNRGSYSEVSLTDALVNMPTLAKKLTVVEEIDGVTVEKVMSIPFFFFRNFNQNGTVTYTHEPVLGNNQQIKVKVNGVDALISETEYVSEYTLPYTYTVKNEQGIYEKKTENIPLYEIVERIFKEKDDAYRANPGEKSNKEEKSIIIGFKKDNRFFYRVATFGLPLSKTNYFASYLVELSNAISSNRLIESVEQFEKENFSFKLVKSNAPNAKGARELRVILSADKINQVKLEIQPWAKGSDRYSKLKSESNSNFFKPFTEQELNNQFKQFLQIIIPKDVIKDLVKEIDLNSDIVKQIIDENEGLKEYRNKVIDTKDDKEVRALYSKIHDLANRKDASKTLTDFVKNTDGIMQDFSFALKDAVYEMVDKIEKAIESKDTNAKVKEALKTFLNLFKEDFTINNVFSPEYLLVDRKEDGTYFPKVSFSMKDSLGAQEFSRTIQNIRLKDQGYSKFRLVAKNTIPDVSATYRKEDAPGRPQVPLKTQEPISYEPEPDNVDDEDESDGGAFSLIDSTELIETDDADGIRDARQWFLENAPSFIGISDLDVSKMIENLKIDGTVLGMYMNNFIYLNQNMMAKGIIYHETFHAIFRSVFTNEQRQRLIQEVLNNKKYSKFFTKESLDAFAKKRNFVKSAEEIIERQAEEILADGFQNYMLKEQKTKPKGLLAQFFELLKRLLNFFIKNRSIIENEYGKIKNGYYKTATVSSEVLTDSSPAFQLIPSLRERYLGPNGKSVLKTTELCSLGREDQEQLIGMMVKLILDQETANINASFDEKFQIARTSAIALFDIDNIIANSPNLKIKDRAELVRLFGKKYHNFQFVLGARLNGITVPDINVTGNSNKDFIKPAENNWKDPLTDNVIENVNGEYSLKILKELVYKKYVLDSKLEIVKDDQVIDKDALYDQVYNNGEPKPNNKDNTDSLDDVLETGINEYGDGNFTNVDLTESNVSLVRQFFSRISINVEDPETGLNEPRVVDGQAMFNSIMKLSAGKTSDKIIDNIRIRLLSYEKEKNYNKYYYELKTVYDEIKKITGLDENNKETKNRKLYNLISLVFSTVELNYAFTVVKTINKDETQIKDFKISDRVQDTDLKLKEKRFFDGIITKFNAIKNLKPGDERLKAHYQAVVELSNIINKNINIEKGNILSSIGNTPSIKLEKIVDNIYKQTQILGIDLPRALIKLSLLGISKYEDTIEFKGVLDKSDIEFFENDIEYVREGKVLSRKFFKEFDTEILQKMYEVRESAVYPSNSFIKTTEGRFKKVGLSAISDLSIAYKKAAAYIIKYDPTDLPNVIRNAEGSPIYRYVKPGTIANMTRTYRQNDFQSSLKSMSSHYEDYLKPYMMDSPVFGILFKDRSAYANDQEKLDQYDRALVFLKNFEATYFGGVQQQINDIFKEGKTYGDIDEASLYMVSIASFMNRDWAYDSKNRIQTFNRVFHQLEGTRTNYLMTGIYKRFVVEEVPEKGQEYDKETGRLLYRGQLAIVESLEQKIKQYYQRMVREYSRSKKLLKEYEKGNTDVKLILGYNALEVIDEDGKQRIDVTSLNKLRAYQFGIFNNDFFSNPENEILKNELLKNVTLNKSFEELDPSILAVLRNSLNEFALKEYNTFITKLEKLELIEGRTIQKNFDPESPIISFFTSSFIPTVIKDFIEGNKSVSTNYVLSEKFVGAVQAPTDLEPLLFDYFMNDWYNRMMVNDLIDGDISMGFKNDQEYVKRLKKHSGGSDNMGIGLHKRAVFSTIKAFIHSDHKEYGPYTDIDQIDADTKIKSDILRQKLKDDFKKAKKGVKETNAGVEVDYGKMMREIFDGQSIVSLMHLIQEFDTRGRIDDEMLNILIEKNFRTLTEDEVSKLEKNGVVLNSQKTLTAGIDENIKQSETYYDRSETSNLIIKEGSKQKTIEKLKDLYKRYYDLQRKRKSLTMFSSKQELQDIDAGLQELATEIHTYWKPKKHRKQLHDMLNSMEYYGIDQAHDTTSSKNVTVFPVNLEHSDKMVEDYFNLDFSAIYVPNDQKYFQVETSGVKDYVKNSVQKKVLIDADTNNILQIAEIDAMKSGVPISESERVAIAAINGVLRQYRRANKMSVESRFSYLKNILRKGGDIDIISIYKNISKNLEAQGAPKEQMELFAVKKIQVNGETVEVPIVGPNNAEVRPYLIYYFTAMYSKHVTDEIVAGGKNFVVSAWGYDVIENKLTGNIIPTDVYNQNSDKIDEDPRYKSRPLGVTTETKYDDNGMPYTVYYVEAIVPKPHFKSKEEESFWMENISKQFAVRIPTEDKRSMIVIKVVDFVDSAKLNTIIVPYFAHILSGGDFDIDSLFIQMKAYYKDSLNNMHVYGDYSNHVDLKAIRKKASSILASMDEFSVAQMLGKKEKDVVWDIDSEKAYDIIVNDLIADAQAKGEYIEFLHFIESNKEFKNIIRAERSNLTGNKNVGEEEIPDVIIERDSPIWNMIKHLGFTNDEIFKAFDFFTDPNEKYKNLPSDVNEKWKLKDEYKNLYLNAKRLAEAMDGSPAYVQARNALGAQYAQIRKETYEITRTKQILDTYIKYQPILKVMESFGIPVTIDEFESNPEFKKMVVYKYQNDFLDASMDILSNEAVFRRMYINTESSTEIFEDLLDRRGIELDTIARQANLFTITQVIQDNTNAKVFKSGIEIVASNQKFLAMASSINAELSEDNIIWKFYNLNKGEVRQYKDFSYLNDDNERTLKINGILLGIFTDGLKKPIPAAMMLNTINVSTQIAMTSIGMSLDFVTAFNYLPILKRAQDEFEKLNRGVTEEINKSFVSYSSEIGKQIFKLLEENPEALIELDNKGIIDITKSKISKFGNIYLDFKDFTKLGIGYNIKSLDQQKLKDNTLTTDELGFIVQSMDNATDLSENAKSIILAYLYMKQVNQTWDIVKATSVTNFHKKLNPDITRIDKMFDNVRLLKNYELLFTKETIDRMFDQNDSYSTFYEIMEDFETQLSKILFDRTPLIRPIISQFDNMIMDKNTLPNVLSSYLTMQSYLRTRPGSRVSVDSNTQQKYNQDDKNLLDTFKEFFWFEQDFEIEEELAQKLSKENVLLPVDIFSDISRSVYKGKYDPLFRVLVATDSAIKKINNQTKNIGKYTKEQAYDLLNKWNEYVKNPKDYRENFIRKEKLMFEDPLIATEGDLSKVTDAELLNFLKAIRNSIKKQVQQTYEVKEEEIIHPYKFAGWKLGNDLKLMQAKEPNNKLLQSLTVVENTDKMILVEDPMGEPVQIPMSYITSSGLSALKPEEMKKIYDDAAELYNKEREFTKRLFYHELARTGGMYKAKSFYRFFPLEMKLEFYKTTTEFAIALFKNQNNFEKFVVQIKKMYKDNSVGDETMIRLFNEMFLQLGYAVKNEKNNTKLRNLSYISFNSQGNYKSSLFNSLNLDKVTDENEKMNLVDRIFVDLFEKVFHADIADLELTDSSRLMLEKSFGEKLTVDLNIQFDNKLKSYAGKGTVQTLATALGIKYDKNLAKYVFPVMLKFDGAHYLLQNVDDFAKSDNFGEYFIKSVKNEMPLTFIGEKAVYVKIPDQFGPSELSQTAFTSDTAKVWSETVMKDPLTATKLYDYNKLFGPVTSDDIDNLDVEC